MSLAVGGIVSGLDTASIVSSLVSAAAIPKSLLEEDLAEAEEAQEAFAGLSNRIDTFLEALEAMDTADELRSLTGTSNDESAVTVTLAGDAVMGSYDVQVNALASNEMEVSQGYAQKDSDGAFPSGVLSITYAGVATEITLSEDDTSLQNVVDAINEQVDGITAYIMDTGDPTEPYRMVLVGDATGAASSIEVDTSGLTGATGTAPTFTQTSTATDASITVNGVTITDDDNVIDKAIQGVSFTIKEVTTAPVVVDVAQDDDAVVAKVQAFVDAYNAVISYIDQQKVFDPEEDIKGPFVGESLVRRIESQMQAALTGFYEDGSTVKMLADMGVTSSQSGEMEFDEEKFREMLETDYEGVIDFFTVDIAEDADLDISASFLNRLRETLTIVNDEETGLLAARDASIVESMATTQERIDAFDEYLLEYEERLNAQFLNMELTLARLQAGQQALTALLPSTDSSSDSSS